MFLTFSLTVTIPLESVYLVVSKLFDGRLIPRTCNVTNTYTKNMKCD